LKEILTNLIGNAIKYTLTGGGIDISHESKDGFLVTHVKDRGMGIAPEEKAKLFAKFYRIKTAETRTIEGTGLGLFICREIIERMGGRIGVESEPGKGSDFWFSLGIIK
jgi:signal transduction histidine kinase